MTASFRLRTMSCKTGIAVAMAVGTLVAARHAVAQENASVLVDVGECVEISSPDERFACYERRVEAARLRDAGFTEAHAERRQVATSPTADLKPQTAPKESEIVEMFGTIAAIREPVPNSYVIALDNGEVWRQTTAKRYPMQPGQKVTIRSTSWGDSFRLSAEDSKGFIQVRRVQ
jgi:hypothetical protein